MFKPSDEIYIYIFFLQIIFIVNEGIKVLQFNLKFLTSFMCNL